MSRRVAIARDGYWLDRFRCAFGILFVDNLSFDKTRVSNRDPTVRDYRPTLLRRVDEMIMPLRTFIAGAIFMFVYCPLAHSTPPATSSPFLQAFGKDKL